MDWENITIGFLFQKGRGRSNQRNPMIYLTHKWVQMTNQLAIVIGVVAVVVIGVVARVVVGVGVELRLRLWKLDVVAQCNDNSLAVTATSVSISTPCSCASAAPTSPLPPMGRFGGILIH